MLSAPATNKSSISQEVDDFTYLFLLIPIIGKNKYLKFNSAKKPTLLTRYGIIEVETSKLINLKDGVEQSVRLLFYARYLLILDKSFIIKESL